MVFLRKRLRCGSCDALISHSALTCPVCGTHQNGENEPTSARKRQEKRRKTTPTPTSRANKTEEQEKKNHKKQVQSFGKALGISADIMSAFESSGGACARCGRTLKTLSGFHRHVSANKCTLRTASAKGGGAAYLAALECASASRGVDNANRSFSLEEEIFFERVVVRLHVAGDGTWARVPREPSTRVGSALGCAEFQADLVLGIEPGKEDDVLGPAGARNAFEISASAHRVLGAVFAPSNDSIDVKASQLNDAKKAAGSLDLRQDNDLFRRCVCEPDGRLASHPTVALRRRCVTVRLPENGVPSQTSALKLLLCDLRKPRGSTVFTLERVHACRQAVEPEALEWTDDFLALLYRAGLSKDEIRIVRSASKRDGSRTPGTLSTTFWLSASAPSMNKASVETLQRLAFRCQINRNFPFGNERLVLDYALMQLGYSLAQIRALSTSFEPHFESFSRSTFSARCAFFAFKDIMACARTKRDLTTQSPVFLFTETDHAQQHTDHSETGGASPQLRAWIIAMLGKRPWSALSESVDGDLPRLRLLRMHALAPVSVLHWSVLDAVAPSGVAACGPPVLNPSRFVSLSRARHSSAVSESRSCRREHALATPGKEEDDAFGAGVADVVSRRLQVFHAIYTFTRHGAAVPKKSLGIAGTNATTDEDVAALLDEGCIVAVNSGIDPATRKETHAPCVMTTKMFMTCWAIRRDVCGAVEATAWLDLVSANDVQEILDYSYKVCRNSVIVGVRVHAPSMSSTIALRPPPPNAERERTNPTRDKDRVVHVVVCGLEFATAEEIGVAISKMQKYVLRSQMFGSHGTQRVVLERPPSGTSTWRCAYARVCASHVASLPNVSLTESLGQELSTSVEPGQSGQAPATAATVRKNDRVPPPSRVNNDKIFRVRISDAYVNSERASVLKKDRFYVVDGRVAKVLSLYCADANAFVRAASIADRSSAVVVTVATLWQYCESKPQPTSVHTFTFSRRAAIRTTLPTFWEIETEKDRVRYLQYSSSSVRAHPESCCAACVR